MAKTVSVSEDSIIAMLKGGPEDTLADVFSKTLIQSDTSPLTAEERTSYQGSFAGAPERRHNQLARPEIEFSRQAARQYRKLPKEYRRLIDVAAFGLSQGLEPDLRPVTGECAVVDNAQGQGGQSNL